MRLLNIVTWPMADDGAMSALSWEKYLDMIEGYGVKFHRLSKI